MLTFPNNTWAKVLPQYVNPQDMTSLSQKVDALYHNPNHIIYPKETNVFKALSMTDYPNVKAIILGQDPYHTPNTAMGLSFSIDPSNPVIPPSLQNIYKERQADLNIAPSTNGDLSPWAKQGVLLLNTILTVEQHQALSHQNLGWQEFTDAVIKALNNRPNNQPIVYLLWGRKAQDKLDLIDTTNPNTLIIESTHPSPFSAAKGRNSFFGSRPFSRTNQFLTQHNVTPIDWHN